MYNYIYYFRHGLGRTDFYILNDPELSFREIVQKNLLSAVSGSFTTEMLEAAKTEAIKPDKAKTEIAKSEVTKADIIKSETSITEITMSKESVKSDIVKSEELNLEEPTEMEKINSEVKLESDELQENEVKKVEINEPITSEKNESLSIEISILEKSRETKHNVVEKEEETSEEKSEPIKINQENVKLDLNDDNCKQEESSDTKMVQSNCKSSESIDQQYDNEKLEDIIEDHEHFEIQNTDTVELQINKSENKTSNNVDSQVKSVNKEGKDVISGILSDASSKTDTKVIESIKSKECSVSAESVDRLKAMFPELEVVHKDVSTPTLDKLPTHKPLQQIDQTIAHLLVTSYQNPIKWPKVNYLSLCYVHF